MFSDRSEDNKNEDELDDLRQQLSSKSGLEYEEKRNDLSVSKNVFIGAISGVVLAGIVGWFVLSPRYASQNPGDIPVIRRPQNAVKTQPADPGGMEILNQDKTVYDIIDKKGADIASVENILPPPEEPQLPTIAPKEPEPVATISDIIETSEVTDTINEAKEIVKVEKTDPPVEVKVVEKIETPKKEEVKIPEPQNVAPTATVASKGSWQVQLMASTNKKAVADSWDSLSKKYPVLKKHSFEIETADLGAKGIYYRLQAGAFADRSGADSLCSEIKSLGGSCIVKKK